MAPDLAGVRVHVLTVSDRSSRGERADTAGPVLSQAFAAIGAEVSASIAPDGTAPVRDAILTAIAGGARIVITTGGTGVSDRDLTPEATAPLIVRALPGLAERLRAVDAESVPTAVLSRGLAGITAGGSIVVNVAGSPGAARSGAAVLIAVLPHAIAQLDGEDH